MNKLKTRLKSVAPYVIITGVGIGVLVLYSKFLAQQHVAYLEYLASEGMTVAGEADKIIAQLRAEGLIKN